MTRLTIATPPDFSLEATVVSHGWYVLPPFRWDARSGRLHRVEWFDGAGAFELTIRHDGRLVVESKPDLSPVRDELRARLRRMFQLELELGSFHALCQKRKSHRPVADAKFGRLLCGSTLFEDAVKIIATTNTAWGQTVRMVTQIVDACGGQTDSGSRAFPTPAQIAALGDAALRQRCRLGYRAPYVHALADGVASGTLDLREIANPALTTEELFKSYRRLPGIGPYGAAHLLAMDGRHDYIAVDTEFRSFVRRRHFRGVETSDADMLAVYERWGKWRYMGYWSELWLDLSRKVEKNEEKRQ
ncbi:MAG: DNA-3-methyladenine glycosylase family protein [Thermoanaerobaculia bacterium]